MPEVPTASVVRLLGQDQSIINFDAKVTNGAFQFGIPEQELAGAKVAGSLIDQGHFCSPEAVRPIERGIEADQGQPAVEQAAVLPGRYVIAGSAAAREEPIASCR